jgi:hypothetical protein
LFNDVNMQTQTSLLQTKQTEADISITERGKNVTRSL